MVVASSRTRKAMPAIGTRRIRSMAAARACLDARGWNAKIGGSAGERAFLDRIHSHHRHARCSYPIEEERGRTKVARLSPSFCIASLSQSNAPPVQGSCRSLGLVVGTRLRLCFPSAIVRVARSPRTTKSQAEDGTALDTGVRRTLDIGSVWAPNQSFHQGKIRERARGRRAFPCVAVEVMIGIPRNGTQAPCPIPGCRRSVPWIHRCPGGSKSPSEPDSVADAELETAQMWNTCPSVGPAGIHPPSHGWVLVATPGWSWH
mmetsp:Transcript_1523/g.9372  ORF Transcript_1523/g.9372 Transcript_1523/m.9372 type:complete len:261 (+) Transcript_1523:1944-2726(+)